MSIQQTVILAAGQGTRLRKDQQDFLKPLYPLRGRPLISHVMNGFASVGVKTFYVVVGFAKEELIPGLQRVIPSQTKLNLIDNPDWSLSNGVSLHKAKNQVKGRFFLSMSDHLFQPAMIETLERGAKADDCLYLAVDRKLESIFDMDDATKVQVADDRIVEIGKNLTEYNAVDTGLFVCPSQIFAFLENEMKEGDCSLSDGVRAMAAAGKARVVDIGNAFWQDVDTPQMLSHAETWLEKNIR
jgi:1L-myo-inositol 1-phosphate cytidylyltransferase